MVKQKKLKTFKTLKEFREDKCIPGVSKGWSKAELISFAVTNKLDVPGGINNANKTTLCSAIENHFTGKNLPPVLSGSPPTIAKIKPICTDLGKEWNSKWRKADFVRECWDKRKMVESVAKQILEKPPTIAKLQTICKKLNIKYITSGKDRWKKADYVDQCWNVRNEIARTINETILEKPPTIPKLQELCDELGIKYNTSGKERWKKADYVENCWNVRDNPREIIKSREASRKQMKTEVSVGIKEAVPIGDLKQICRERGIKVKKGWKVKDYMTECFKELGDLEDSFSIGKKDKFIGKIKREANFAMSNIAALLYLLSKHGSNVCLGIDSGMVKKKGFGVNEFCDFELCWKFELFNDGTGHYAIDFMSEGTEDDLWSRIKKCKKRFVLIPLYLSGAFRDTKKIAHHNYIIVDKNRRTLERFEPNGYDIDYYNLMRLGIPYLDTFLKESCQKHKYRNLRTMDFCPAIGPQKLEKLQMEEKYLEEGGFCTFWSIWYADQRFKYPDVKPDKLIHQLIDQFKKKNVYTELRTFMRNYIAFLEKERKTLIREAKKMKGLKNWSERSLIIHLFQKRLGELESDQLEISSSAESE